MFLSKYILALNNLVGLELLVVVYFLYRNSLY